MTFLEKFKLWLKSTGLTNIGYAIGFIAALVLGFKFLAGAMLGIWIYVNFNVIYKLILNRIPFLDKS